VFLGEGKIQIAPLYWEPARWCERFQDREVIDRERICAVMPRKTDVGSGPPPATTPPSKSAAAILVNLSLMARISKAIALMVLHGLRAVREDRCWPV
jgi:hypothetical protein